MQTVSKLHNQVKSQNQRRINSSHRKFRGQFIPIPKGYLRKIPRSLQPAFQELWEYGHCRPCTMPYRLLAARLRVHKRTAERMIQGLLRTGHLGVSRRRIAWNRNAPNIYYFPQLADFLEQKSHGKNAVEIQTQNLKPLTTSARGAEFSKPDRIRYNHPPAMRKLYALNRELMRRLGLREDREKWRFHAALERTRMAMNARVGVFIPVAEAQKPMSESEIEMIRQRIDRGQR